MTKQTEIETKKEKPHIWVIIMIALIVIPALVVGLFELFGEPKQQINPNLTFIEDTDIITDFNNDGYADYVKYIYVEIIYGGEEVNFRSGTGE